MANGTTISMATVSLPCSPGRRCARISMEDGSLILNRYRVIKNLGEGTFGKVLDVVDKSDRKRKALKFIKDDPLYPSSAKNEESIIRVLHDDPSPHKDKIIRLFSSFEVEGYTCLVYERLGSSLFDIFETRGYERFALSEIREIGRQILEAIALIHSHGITHCDLKPANILFIDDQTVYHKASRVYRLADLRVKVIDFGISTYDWDYHSPTITTQEYRAPEVFLGILHVELGWTRSADIWSIGCILVELYTGCTLFPLSSEYCHLAMMEKLLGRMPTSMVRSCSNRLKPKFGGKLQLQWPKNAISAERQQVDAVPYIHDLIPADSPESGAFRRAITAMLEFNPIRRITASQAVQLPFFQGNY